MKVCPICGARAFDDAELCYGCLHRYDERADDEEAAGGLAEELEGEVALAGNNADALAEPAPSFLLRFEPVVDVAGAVTWSCSVELA